MSDAWSWLTHAPAASPFPLGRQAAWLFLLAVPIACAAWTVTHEEVFREPREYCVEQSKTAPNLVRRKFFYLFTCEYCFSHYVTLFFLWLTHFQFLLAGWRGYLAAWFALVWIANQYMSIFGLLRLDIKHERVEIKGVQAEVEKKEHEVEKLKEQTPRAA